MFMENETKEIIKKLTHRSVKYDKKKNLFCVATITIAVAMIMMALLTVQNIIHQNQLEAGSLHQGIYFDVPQGTEKLLSSQEGVKKVGLSSTIKTLNDGEQKITLLYYDSTMYSLIDSFEGKYPSTDNEIAVTDSFIDSQNVHLGLNSSVSLNLDGDEKEYTIVGIYHDNAKQVSNYPIFVSYEKCRELRNNDLLNAYVWLEDADMLSKEEATEILKEISVACNIPDWTISGYYEYIHTEMSVSNFIVYGLIAGVLFLAAALVIYSIFYISVGHKVAQYGQLRTIGASRKQIYKVVLKEGILLSIPGILFGCVIGILVSYLLQPDGWTISALLVSVFISTLFGILLVYISVRKPAKIAASISPISALKNQGAETAAYGKHKQHRITPAYLAKMNFLRNRKKSILTVLSMGLCGIIFFLAASYQSSFNAESMARFWDFPNGEFKITVNLEDDTVDLGTALRKEYFDNYRTEIAKMEGVENMYSYFAVPVNFRSDKDTVSDTSLLLGYNESNIENLNEALLSGEITEDTELIVSDPDRVYDVYHWKPEVGEDVSFRFHTKNGEDVTRTFTIGALTSSADRMGGYIFRMPEELLKELVGYDCTYAVEVKVESEKYDDVEQSLSRLIAGNGEVYLDTLKNETAIRQSDNAAGFVLAYAISIILGVFAILNQINLTVTNLLNRRHEIGILKSVGMTNEQLIKSFFIEGMMISGMAILLTILLGIPGGYCIGGFLKNAGMATGFQFPKVAFSTFIVLIILVESAMTLLSINSLKKQSVIEAISA